MLRKLAAAMATALLCQTAATLAWATPPIGTWKVGVLMVDFPNLSGPATLGGLPARTYYNNLLFGNHPSNAPNGSMKDYYTEVSYNQLTVTGQVNTGTTNWYRMPQPSTSYGDYNSGNTTQILVDAVGVANSAGFDFGPLDNDNDGYVDAIFVVRADYGRGYASTWNIPTGDTNAHGNPVSTGRFSVIYAGSTFTIGVFAHEFGHNLGLPDLYDVDDSSEGLGRWSLMAYGTHNGSNYRGDRPAHPDAWSKVALGWVTPVVPTTAVSLNLPPVETNQSIYKLRTPTKEYFLLENRQALGFDAELPYWGLLIYHVDDAISNNRQESYPGCTICTSHYKVALEQADGLFELEKFNLYGGLSDSGDPYPIAGNTAFTPTSTPNSSTYTNINSGVSVTGIARSGSNIAASIAAPPPGLDFPITQAGNAQSAPRVAFDGTNYMAVWNDARTTPNDIYAARVSPSGAILDPAGLLIGNGLPPDIAFDGTNYLIVWAQNGSVVGTRISPAGSVLDLTPISIGTGFAPRLAFDGTNYMVVWNEYQSGSSADIFGARVSPAGTVLDPGGVALVAASGDQFLPQIAYGGGNHFLVWSSGSMLLGSRMTPSGTLLEPAGIVLTTFGNSAAVAYQGSGFLTVWAESGRIKGARVSNAGVPLSPVPLSISNSTTSSQSAPAVAFNGLNPIVVWDDSAAGIQGTWMSASGILLSSTPATLSMSSGDVEAPAVSPGPVGLAVWSDWRNQPSALSCTIPSCNVDLYGNFVLNGPVAGYPVAWYPMEDGTIGSVPATIADSSGTNNGTNSGATIAAGQAGLGNALSFNGTSNTVSIPANADLQLSAGTVEAWIKTSDAGAGSRGIVVQPLAYGLFLNNNVFGIYDWAAGAFRTSGVNLADGIWHHVAATFQSGTTFGTTLYVDGNAVSTTTMTIEGQTANVRIGSSESGTTVIDHFAGVIDQVKMFNRTLSPGEMCTEAGKTWIGSICVSRGTTTYTFVVNTAGTGSGMVTSSPAGINCGVTCSAPFDAATMVTLTAVPDAASAFAGWSGACTGTGVCVVTMDRAKSVTAAFTVVQQPVSFSAATAFVAGSGPESVAIGDLNGDGKTDLAVANAGSNTVSILLGDGTGTFGASTAFAVGVTPRSVAIGDLNGDGQPDLAVANGGSDTVSILLGTGTGAFGAATSVPVGGDNPSSVAIGDLNRDGQPDLAVTNADGNTVSILLSTSTGAFGAATSVPVGTNPVSVAIGDLNGDGQPDLAVANAGSNTVSILLGAEFGVFGAATNVPVGTNPTSVAIGDLNGDGQPDLAVANAGSNTVSILLGDGTGAFGAATNVPVGTNPRSVTISDLNGDGQPDLAVVSASNSTVSVLLGDGTGAFGAATAFATGGSPAFSVAIGDLNGDGKPDLAVGAVTSPVSILLNTTPYAPSGAFSAATNFATGVGNPLSVAIGDLNGDGQPDLAVVNADSNTVSILLGTGTGAFGAATSFAVGRLPFSVAIGDLNRDGQPDLAVVNLGSNTVSILLGTGTGAFGAATDVAVGSGPYSVAIGDLNRDGRPDLAVVNAGSGTVSILLNSSTAPRLVNISTRARVLTGDNVLIGGFIIGGTDPKTVLIRARGPSMEGAPFNVPGTLANPFVQFYSFALGNFIAQNDNWQVSDPLCAASGLVCGGATEISATGLDPCQPNPGQTSAPPGCSQESAILMTLPPGNYGVIVSGMSGGTGVGLVEVFDVGSGTSRLINISTRAFVETGDNVEIGGFIIGGTGPKTVLIRARGPSMGGAPFNVPATLANPFVQLYSFATGTFIAQNDNWQVSDPLCAASGFVCGGATEISATGLDPCIPNPEQISAPPGCSQESAILMTLPPGNYGAIVSGVSEGTGVGLVEVFEVP